VFQSVVSALNPKLEAVETSRRTLDQIGEDVGEIKKTASRCFSSIESKNWRSGGEGDGEAD
jgi:hypothetical protein